MTAIPLVLSAILAWMPTVDGQRVGFGYHEPPYWLGISIPPWSHAEVIAKQNEQVLFVFGNGTHTQLSYIDSNIPIEFYENNRHIGTIVPEPTALTLLSMGV